MTINYNFGTKCFSIPEEDCEFKINHLHKLVLCLDRETGASYSKDDKLNSIEAIIPGRSGQRYP